MAVSDSGGHDHARLRDLTTLLRCVACGGGLGLDSAAMTCRTCGRQVPIVDGIPQVRLVDEDPALERERRAVLELESHEAVLAPESTVFSLPALLAGPGPLRDAVLSLPDDNGSAFFRDNEYFRNVAAFAPRFRDVVAALALPPGSRVLDVGADLTWSTARLAQHGWRAVGIDINHHLSASRVFQAHGFDYAVVNMDMHAPAFADGVFDGITAINALHHTHRLAPLVANLARMLRPGGRLAFIEPYWFHEETRRAFGVTQIDAGINENVYRLEEWHQLFVTHGLELVSFIADAAFRGLYEKTRHGAPRAITVDQARDELFEPFYRGRLATTAPRVHHVMPGGALSLPITVHNDSTRVWCRHSQVPVLLSYHLYAAADGAGTPRALLRYDFPRTGLCEFLRPGEHDTVLLPIEVPAAPGRYEIDVDLVHEGITWFSGRGVASLTAEVVVAP